MDYSRITADCCAGLEKPRHLYVVNLVYKELCKLYENQVQQLSVEDLVLIHVLFGAESNQNLIHQFKLLNAPEHEIFGKTCKEDIPTEIQRRKQISLLEFRQEFLSRNLPVLIEDAGTEWGVFHKSRKGWINEQMGLDLEKLNRLYGACIVPVEEEDGSTKYMSFNQFHQEWRNNQNYRGYLKDWHIYLHDPAIEKRAPVPKLFTDDWLNQYYIPTGVDYRFAYLGKKGTKTGLHCDIMNTYSWSTNISGEKLWHLVSPNQTHLLFDIFGNNVAPDLYSIPAKLSWQYPNLKRVKPIIVLQKQFETIFIPSGWYHTVQNLEDTLSINANWLNGYNLEWCATAIVSSLKRCKEVSRSKGDEKIMNALNFEDFIMILRSKLSMLWKQVGSLEEESAQYIQDVNAIVRVCNMSPAVDLEYQADIAEVNQECESLMNMLTLELSSASC